VTATVIGFLAYFALKRSMFAGVAIGEAVLLLGGYFFAR